MSQQYKTRQRAVVEQLLAEHTGEHLTAESIVSLLAEKGESVGKATVYRTLERLTEQGTVKKYLFGEGKSACYEYCAGKPLYHLRCCECGELTHLDCEFLDELPEHVFEHHGFTLDSSQIVLVGKCAKCSEKSCEGKAEKKCR